MRHHITRLLAMLVLPLVAACGTRVHEYEWGIETSYGKIVTPHLNTGFNGEFYGTDTHLIPMTEQNFPAQDDDPKTPDAEVIPTIQTKDSVIVSAEVAMTWEYNPCCVVDVYRSKRAQGSDDAIQRAVLFEIANSLRDGTRAAATQFPVDQLIGAGREQFETLAKQKVQEKFGNRYILKKFWVRAIDLPQTIIAARQNIFKQQSDLTAAQNLQKINEANANAQIAMARGEAEATRLRAESYAQHPALLQLEIAKALQNICANAATCVLGPSVVGGLTLTGGEK